MIRPLSAVFGIVLLGAGGTGLAPVRGVVDSYFGIRIADPYRYFESNDPAYVAWKARQGAATRAMLARARKGPRFAHGTGSVAEASELSSLTVVAGHAFYVSVVDGVDTLYERDLAGGAEHAVVNGGRFDSQAGGGSIGAFAVSSDAKLVAIHVYVGRAVESDVHILRAEDGSDVEPPLQHTIFDYVGFMPGNGVLLYAKGASSTTSMSMPDKSYDYVHRLGSPQSADTIVFGPGVSRSVDVPARAYAFVDPGDGGQAVAEVRDPGAGGSRFYTAPLETVGKPDTPWRALGTVADGYTDYTVHGTTIDLATATGAPNFKVVRASLVGPFEPKVVLPPSSTVVVSGTLDGIPKAGIFSLYAASDADYVQLLHDGVNEMVRIPYVDDPKPTPVDLPIKGGSILEVATDVHAPGALLEMTSWIVPGDVYAYDPANGETHGLGIVKVTGNPSAGSIELTATASDGTPIRVSVVYRPGIALDGKNPTILRVAGAYGFSITPDFHQVPQQWLARGGVYAVAHVRGGGDRGEDWHRAGMGTNKSKTWTDLIAAAQRLIELGYTSPKMLNLYGTTQSYLGGIASSVAIGRAIEERPDLFAAAVVDAPLFDMLRSERTGLGRQSVSEFGSVATKDGFAALLAMSPYEHVRAGVGYPPVLVRSLAHFGIGDDWQAAKMVARLQAARGREGAAFLDLVGATPADRRARADLRDDAYAFFLYEDGSR